MNSDPRRDDEDEPDVPSIEELTRPALQCAVCNSTVVRIDSPAMRWVLLVGGAMSLWLLYRGAVSAAIMFLTMTVVVAGGVKARWHYRKCEMCGHEWHRSKQPMD